MSAVLSVTRLRIEFEQYDRGLRRRIIEPVKSMSLEAFPGEVVALVGASGAGKSLLGSAVFGILPANATVHGSIVFDGIELSDASRQRRSRELSLLPQSVSFLDPLATVGAQLTRAAELAGLADARGAASDALQRCGLHARIWRLYPHQLSGGMARRVLFAIATLGHPRLLFADEPTPGLHPDAARNTLRRLRDIADAGTAVILVTHDLTASLEVADRVIVCHEGSTLPAASPAAFSGDGDALTHPYTRALWRALPSNGFVAAAEAAL